MTGRPARLLILTGDPSADQHAAHLVSCLQQRSPELSIEAVGGAALAECGVSVVATPPALQYVGLAGPADIVRHALLALKIIEHVRRHRPGLILMIDYGGFHLKLAQELKTRLGRQCPLIHYWIPPQLWASRPWRINAIRRWVDHVYCIFPFEEALYRRHGVSVTDTGHPLAAGLPARAERTAFCAANGLQPDKPVVGLFPGSRAREVTRLLPVMLASLPHIQAARPDAQFAIAQAPNFTDEQFNHWLKKAAAAEALPSIHIIRNQNHGLLSTADAVMVASGTVTLEAALYDTPMVLMYHIAPWLMPVFRWICQVPYIGLPNLLAPDVLPDKQNPPAPIVPELLGADLTPEKLAGALLPLLDPDSPESRNAHAGFTAIRNKMAAGAENPVARLAQGIRETLNLETTAASLSAGHPASAGRH
ncbi:MAG: lipid-A-disaccharide synthase [Candidatus Melainabacteria bacterium]